MWTTAGLLALTLAAALWSSAVNPATGSTTRWRGLVQERANTVPLGSGRLVYDEHRRRVLLLDALATPRSSGEPKAVRSWSWSGRDWELLPGAGPAWRVANAAVFDAARGRIVMFGGATIPATASGDETWESDGRIWSQMDRGGLPGRDHHTMVYDPTRRRTVLFGGGTFVRGKPYQLRDETWEWDGVDWRRVATGGPEARRLPGMAYDHERRQVVLFGGIGARPAPDTDPPFFGDTWVWNGETWRKVADGGPPARYGHAMTFDARTGVTLMYGGNAVGDGPLADMWQWDGRSWSEIKSSGAAPGARFGAAMVDDAARRRIVLFGGRRDQTSTWEWDGRRWDEIPAR